MILQNVRHEDRAVDLVIEDGRIAAIEASTGSARTGTKIDGGGGTVLPGFVDAHVHLSLGPGDGPGRSCSMSGPRRFRGPARRPGRDPPRGRPDSWLLAHGWLETDWAAAEGDDLPDAGWLAAGGDRPIVCYKHDHHAVLVNDVVLRMLGDLQCPAGGTIVRDGSGRPTGLLLEAAAWSS